MESVSAKRVQTFSKVRVDLGAPVRGLRLLSCVPLTVTRRMTRCQHCSVQGLQSLDDCDPEAFGFVQPLAVSGNEHDYSQPCMTSVMASEKSAMRTYRFR